MKIANWFKSLFVHPKTTIAGIGSLVGAAALGYGMSTGAVPISAESIATIGGLASAGLAGLNASDSKTAEAVSVATTVAPAAIGVVEQIQAMKSDAADAQAKLDAYASMTQAIAQALPETTKQ